MTVGGVRGYAVQGSMTVGGVRGYAVQELRTIQTSCLHASTASSWLQFNLAGVLVAVNSDGRLGPVAHKYTRLRCGLSAAKWREKTNKL